MKRMIIAILAIMLMASTAWASPFLVCDCQTDFDGDYVLIFDGGTPIIHPAVQNDCPVGEVRVNLDMAPLALPDGQHSLEGYAKSVWGESTRVPFDFNKVVPANLLGIGLSATP